VETVRVVPVAVAWIERRGRVLLERRQPGGALRGAWDLPAAVIHPGEPPSRALVRALSESHRFRVRPGRALLQAKHAILATRLVIEVIETTPVTAAPRRTSLRWVSLSKLGEVAISGATKKIARAVAAQRRSHDVRTSASSGSSGRLKA
jgi:8-oxo-dGTP pyrophosphatase MutT (NUDIX family)